MATKTATRSNPPKSQPAEVTNPMVHRISISPVHVTIFKNSTNKGEFYSIKVVRVYKKDEKFYETSSFSAKHLQPLEIAIKEARAWVEDHKLSD